MPRKKNVETKVMQALRKEHLKSCSSLSFDEWTRVIDVMRPLLADYVGNWKEDFSHENGNYMNICIRCDEEFLGHKRRVICKKCFSGF